nr:reverse transcriptase domain-containing protein [Tanacetum cinerariifolium]
MQTRSSSKLTRDQTSNPTSSTNTTSKGHTHRSSKQKVENSNFEEHLPPVASIADNRTMAEMLRAPTEGCAEEIVVPPILAEQFELKHSLINMMALDQFFGLEKDNPYDHIRCSEIAELTHAVNQQTSVVTTAMTAMLKQLQANPPPAPVKAVEETCVTYGAITTRSGLVTDGPTVSTPPKSVTPDLGERVEETYTDPDLTDELKCKALADLGASINLMPLSVWKELGLPELIPTRMTLELANRAICTPAGIARDVFISVGKFTFLADFAVVDYESNSRVPLILGRPFLRIARALIDVHGEEMILRNGDERLTLNMKHETASYSNHPQRESVNLINIFNVSSEDFLEVSVPKQSSGNPTFSLHQELTSPEVTNDIHDSEGCNDIYPYFDDNPLILPFFFAELSLAKPLPVSSGGAWQESPNSMTSHRA